MSNAAGSPSKEKKPGVTSPERPNKGKGKNSKPPCDEAMEEDDDDDDDEEEEDEDEDEEEEEEEDELEEIDPTAIVGRRTRGKKVDYTSKEALAKAGLEAGEASDDDEEMKSE